MLDIRSSTLVMIIIGGLTAMILWRVLLKILVGTVIILVFIGTVQVVTALNSPRQSVGPKSPTVSSRTHPPMLVAGTPEILPPGEGMLLSSAWPFTRR